MISQNELYFKNALQCKIEEFMEEELSGDHDLGYIPDNLVRHMTEAAWLIIASNKDTNDFFDREVLVKNSI